MLLLTGFRYLFIGLFVYVLFLQFSKLSDLQPLRLVEKKFIVSWSVPNNRSTHRRQGLHVFSRSLCITWSATRTVYNCGKAQSECRRNGYVSRITEKWYMEAIFCKHMAGRRRGKSASRTSASAVRTYS
jgi:hypothetical protein